MFIQFPQKCHKLNGGRIVFSTNGTRKVKFRLLSQPYIKINLTWRIDLKPKTVKLWKESLEKLAWAWVRPRLLRFIIKRTIQYFPGGPVVKNLPANAGDMGLIPGLGRFDMSWSNQVCGPQLLKLMHPRAHALKQEKPTHYIYIIESNPCSPQLMKGIIQQWRPSTAKKKSTIHNRRNWYIGLYQNLKLLCFKRHH